MTVTESLCTDTESTMAVGTAARELQLKRGEFAIAAHVGLVRVLVRQGGGGRARVRREEVDRLRAQDGFPEALRERVRTVGTAEGARLLGISPDRFTKLARAGCLPPIAFYLNRYRAVVWLYLAEELAGFAAREPHLLVGKSPAWVRSRLDGGVDHRAREWRSLRIERLLSRTDDPWARAAVLAGALDPVQLAEVVDDPYERVYLARIGSEPVCGPTASPAARETMARLMQADEPDEMLWRRVGLITELDNAREVRPAPRPGDEWRPRPGPGRDRRPEIESERGPESEGGTGVERGVEPELRGEREPGVDPELRVEPGFRDDPELRVEPELRVGPGLRVQEELVTEGEPASVGSASEPALAFDPGPAPEPAPTVVPVRDCAQVRDPAPDPGPEPTAVPEAALRLLARFGLRGRPSRRPC
ncbi:DUF6397 family protein [Streptomyces sp. NBC_00846]|uniref:DUF6397 family protein n=1 Tax=Streptomyces sp. NBC_00846 TaxID=2975849 RepID=UPI00386EA600